MKLFETDFIVLHKEIPYLGEISPFRGKGMIKLIEIGKKRIEKYWSGWGRRRKHY